MTNRTLTDNKGISWTRISKRRARALYDAGYTITVAPVNMRLNNVWCTYIRIGRKLKFSLDDSFDSLVNDYEYYNCNSNEVGHYPAYYVRSEVLE
nr:MAG TPA: hypothetical protein [Caudoviricetes sp.]